jgi:uncharacterized membrane protein
LKPSPDKLFSNFRSKSLKPIYGKPFSDFAPYFPTGLVWCLLDKRGNSNSFERMKLFNQFLERFGGREVACLTADREFVGKDWFG